MVDSFVTDPNPFNPDVPDRIRANDPELYRFLLDQAETLRRVYNESAADKAALQAQLTDAEAKIESLQTGASQTSHGLDQVEYKLGSLDSLELELAGINNKLDVQAGSSKFQLDSISTRVARVNEKLASITFTDSLQAVANFAALAGASAANASGAYNQTYIQASAVNSLSREVKVYRDQTAVFADSVQTLNLQSQVSRDNAEYQAGLALTYKTSASDSAAAASASADLAASYASSTGSDFSALEARVTNAESAAVTESTARAAADTTLTAQLANTAASGLKTSLLASIATVNTAVVDESTARASADTTFAAQIAGTSASGLKTSINAVTTAQSATATSLTALTATVAGNTASLVTQAGAITDAQGKLSAYFSVTAVAGGVASLTVHADGATAGVSIGGDLTIDGDVILTGTHRILLNTGTVMRVQGLGFGTSNQFLSWFGPTMAVASCSESNAISYEKLDGSAYFGGTLNAGIITNAVRTTSLAYNANVQTGTFGSNGHTRNVTVSFQYSQSRTNTTSCPSSPVTPSVVLTLYRGATSAGTFLTSLTVNGTYHCESGTFSEPGVVMEHISGGFTFVDTSGGTTTGYYAEISSLTVNDYAATQVLGLVSVEQ